MSDVIRVLIADDHTVVRQGIRIMLEPKHDFEVVGEAVNGVEAVDLCSTLEPDVLILDLVMPVMDGLETIQKVIKANLRTQILVLTSYSEEEKVISALKAGAKGYILKDSSPNELVDA
ncbi:MAG: response regulator transcription factor, partial [Anaerolineales bacterium]|nr:response regulator transcription factor [Anaerolineales bacterium]